MKTSGEYLGRGVTPESILRRAADQCRVHCAPAEMTERFSAAANVVEQTGQLPAWAMPAHDAKVETLPVLMEDESE